MNKIQRHIENSQSTLKKQITRKEINFISGFDVRNCEPPEERQLFFLKKSFSIAGHPEKLYSFFQFELSEMRELNQHSKNDTNQSSERNQHDFISLSLNNWKRTTN